MKKWILVLLAAAITGCMQNNRMPPVKQAASAGESFDISPFTTEAKDIVRSGLTDENAYIRTNAAETVSLAKQTEMMPLVENLLSDELVPVRFAAALCIGDMKYTAAKDSLRRLISDNDQSVKLAAAYALWRTSGQPYYDFFIKSLSARDQNVRSNAALILGKTGEKRAIAHLKAILRDTQSSDKTMQVAVEAIARLGDESIYPKLWAMMLSTYADDRVMGIRAMGALGTMPARNALITVLDDPVVEVRLAAAEQLGAMGDTAGEPEVLDFFVSKSVSDAERTNRAKALAALAIGRIKTPALSKYLPDLLKSDSKGVKLTAAQAVLLINK